MENKKMKLGERLARKYNTDMPYPMQKGKFLFAFLLCLPAVLLIWKWARNMALPGIALDVLVKKDIPTIPFTCVRMKRSVHLMWMITWKLCDKEALLWKNNAKLAGTMITMKSTKNITARWI